MKTPVSDASDTGGGGPPRRVELTPRARKDLSERPVEYCRPRMTAATNDSGPSAYPEQLRG